MGKIILNGTDYAGSGGSGGHTIVDPTGTDMPQENKLQFTGAVSVSDDAVNGQTVVDIEGGGNYYLNTIFSTEEKKVGYWTDKKPLYQKTFETNYTSNGTYTINISSLNVDTICNSFGEYNRSNGEWTEFNHYSGSTYYGEIRASATQVRMFLQLPESNPQGKQFFTLQYTKSTDTPEVNPQTGDVIYLPTIYSEEEREVGVWTDGKPLYQKSYQLTTPSTTGSAIVIQNIADLNIDTPVNIFGNVLNVPINFFLDYSQNNYLACFVNSAKTGIAMKIGANTYANQSCNVTIQYTKTTDTAGSGSWTPSGANAVHYSTNEQVIGTWIDGKPLYQRTWDFGSNITINSNAWTNTTIDVAGNSIKAIINSKATNDGGTNFNFIACNTDQTYVQALQTRNVAIVVRYLTLEYTKTTD